MNLTRKASVNPNRGLSALTAPIPKETDFNIYK
jgi:CTD small phosphatase-like protein 2